MDRQSVLLTQGIVIKALHIVHDGDLFSRNRKPLKYIFHQLHQLLAQFGKSKHYFSNLHLRPELSCQQQNLSDKHGQQRADLIGLILNHRIIPRQRTGQQMVFALSHIRLFKAHGLIAIYPLP